MKVTSKGQVTIPHSIREKLGITSSDEVDFIEEKGRIILIKSSKPGNKTTRFRALRGVATVKMTTDQIMALTREKA